MTDTSIRILLLCVAAAMLCTSIRSMHPQIATAVALACGIAAMLLSLNDMSSLSEAIDCLESYGEASGTEQVRILKICGIAMIAEFASDICRDANEIVLAHRIDTGVKLGVLASALPLAVEILDQIYDLML